MRLRYKWGTKWGKVNFVIYLMMILLCLLLILISKLTIAAIMKAIYLFLALSTIAAFNSCNQSKIKDAIINYRQTIGKTKLDLKMNISSLEQVGIYTCGDSANAIKSELYNVLNDQDLQKLPIDSIMARIADNIKGWQGYVSELDSTVNVLEQFKRTDDFEYSFYKSKIIEYSEKVTSFKQTYQILDSVNTLIKQYELNANKEIATKWECKYSIQNPLLNNTKQEITDTFLLTKDYHVIGVNPR